LASAKEQAQRVTETTDTELKDIAAAVQEERSDECGVG
jgi:hypothetical protein